MHEGYCKCLALNSASVFYMSFMGRAGRFILNFELPLAFDTWLVLEEQVAVIYI